MGANVHTLDDSPLRLASENGHTNVVEILLKNHADIHANNDWPLRFASASADNHLDVVKLLLKYGANVHAQDDYALRYASINCHYDIVKLLKKYM